MSALERVARRIGMWQGDGLWIDATASYISRVDPPDLRAYLLTGDRPLRVMVAYRMRVGDKTDAEFYALTREHSGYGPTPAAAIIALAEKIEGEQK